MRSIGLLRLAPSAKEGSRISNNGKDPTKNVQGINEGFYDKTRYTPILKSSEKG